MILQCPACNTQYRLKKDNISQEGRRVKCAKCQNSWVASADDLIEEVQSLQEEQKIAVGANYTPRAASTNTARQTTASPVYAVPKVDNASSDDSPHTDPKSVPNQEDFQFSKPNVVRPREAVPRFAVKNESPKKSVWPILLIFTSLIFILMAILIFARKPIVNAWEGSAKFYDMIGLHVSALAEDLKFENIKTSFERDAEGGKIMVLEGEIKNASSDEKVIPALKIFPYKRQDKVLSAAKFKINAEKIRPGESATFKTNLPADTRLDARDEIRFVKE